MTLDIDFSDISEIIKKVRQTTLIAWEQVKETSQVSVEVLVEEGRDIKLDADLLLHKVLSKRLPDIVPVPIVSEEGTLDHTMNLKGSFWVIDPLDGSMNYSRGIECYSISIALILDGELILGCIYHPPTGNFYHGSCCGEAFCNDQKLNVSHCTDTKNAILATGFPIKTDVSSSAVTVFVNNVCNFKKIRMFGAASYSLIMVAEGKVDCYWEDNIMLWDVIAGLILIKAAGGDFKFIEGDEPFAVKVVAGNATLLKNNPKLFFDNGKDRF